jgi:hypothetical protein
VTSRGVGLTLGTAGRSASARVRGGGVARSPKISSRGVLGPRWGRERLTLPSSSQPGLTNVLAGQRLDSTNAAKHPPRVKLAENSVRDAEVRGDRAATSAPAFVAGSACVPHATSFVGRVWAAPEPKMFKASHKCSKAFAQLVLTIQYGSKMLETLRSDLSSR